MNKIKKIFGNIFHLHTIFYQLIIFTLLTSILPLIILMITTSRKTDTLIKEDMIGSYKHMQSQYMASIEYKFNLYENSLEKIASNSIIFDALYSKDQERYSSPYKRGSAISKEIGNFLGLYTQRELANCMIYSIKEDIPVFGTKVTMNNIASKESWYTYYQQMAGTGYFIDKNKSALSLIKDINYIDTKYMTSETIGYVKLDVKMNQLFAPTVETDSGNYYFDIVVMDYNQSIIYSTTGMDVYDDELYKNLSYPTGIGDDTYYYGDYICTSSQVELYPVQVMFFFHIGTLGMKQTSFRKDILLIMEITLVFIVIFSFTYSRSFNKRVSILISKMQKAETGVMEITEYVGGNDEITKLDMHFNRMISELNDLIQKNYIQKMKNREAQFRNLRLQINPHFLYNTLEIVGSIAAANGVMLVANITEKLGEIFRYSLGRNYGENATVKQELLHTKNYIYIQKIRFGDKFEVFYDVDNETYNHQIMRFILQPIVENAILHGLSKTKFQGKLTISIFPQDGRLIVEIEDNGIGMDDQTVKRLTAFINEHDLDEEDNKKSIGVRNVNQRIKLICGEEYGIAIESELGKRTCFTITLPLQ